MSESQETLAVSTQPAEVKTYAIAGKSYHLEPASFAQHEWLGAGPLKDVDLSDGLSIAQFETLIQRTGPDLLGIVLLAEGQTREQKARAGRQAAQELAETIRCSLTPDEVRAIAQDFFPVNGHRNFWYFIDFRRAAASTPDPTIAPPSSPASASSPAETSPSGTGSDAAPVLLTPSPISAGSSSGS